MSISDYRHYEHLTSHHNHKDFFFVLCSYYIDENGLEMEYDNVIVKITFAVCWTGRHIFRK